MPPASDSMYIHTDSTKDPQEIKGGDSIDSELAYLEKSVWRKLDMWILPVFTLFYLLSLLDRTNIGNARVAGMQTSLGISNYQYTVAITTTYIPYIVAELPSTLVLKHVGPDRMLPAMVTLWGIVSALQGMVKNYAGLLACRFFLGLVEGGLFPGMVLYLSFFYPRTRLQIRIAIFYTSASLSGAFSGLLAAAIDHLHGKRGYPGWAWIFILEGGFTFLFGLISFFLLPRSPENARFLTPEERAYIIRILKHDGAVSRDGKRDGFSWSEVGRAARSLHTWALCIVFFFGGTILLSLAYFEPTIVASLGYAGNRAQLMSVPPFAVACVLSITSAFLSDHYGTRGYIAIFFTILQVLGFSMFYVSKSSNIRYVSLFFSISGAYGAAPALIAWIANNTAPHTRRATALAFSFIMANLGGILATWLLGFISPAPDYKTATLTFIIMSSCEVILSVMNVVYLSRENRLKAEKRQRITMEEEEEELGDRSAWFVYSL